MRLIAVAWLFALRLIAVARLFALRLIGGAVFRYPTDVRCILPFMVALTGCYPDFVFNGVGGGSTKSAVTSTTGATTSASSTHATSSSHTTSATTTTTAASTSTGMATAGPPCQVTNLVCSPGQACCFDTSSSNDSCQNGSPGSFSCGSSHIALECNTDADCASGKCCVHHNSSFPYEATGTACKASCPIGDTGGCNPKGNPPCNCYDILGYYYTATTAPAPYNQYGECL